MMQFDDDKAVATVPVATKYTARDINEIVDGALSGSISYWGRLTGITRNSKPDDVEFMTDWCTKLLLDGKHITLADVEEPSEQWSLNLEMLIKGIKKYHELSFAYAPDNYDATSYDCIFQYALFDEVVYG